MTEKRVNDRSPIELAASFGIPDESPATKPAKVINISSGGFCFYSKASLKEKESLQLHVELEEDEAVDINVQVVWVKPVEGENRNMVGVQITDQSGENLQRFLDFYKNLN